MRDFDLTLADGWVLVFLIPVCIYLAVQVYRTRQVAWLLGLRILALVLVVVLLMAPILAVRFQTTRKPLVAVLVDNSESMQIGDGEVPRKQVVLEGLQLDAFGQLENQARVHRFRFAESLFSFDSVDELSWTGQATNFAGAFDALREETAGQGLGAVVLLSDGGQNQGERPERSVDDLGVPVYAVGIGDPVPPKDVVMVSGVIDRLGYVGKKLSLSVRLRASGYEGIQERVVVKEGGQEVASQIVALHNGEQALTFEIAPQRAGRHAYRVGIAHQADERTEENNAVVVATEVLESRVKLLVVAGKPSADLAYLQRVWADDENLELEWVVNKGLGGWGAQVQRALRDLGKTHVVVLIDVDHSVLAGDAEQRVVNFAKNGGGVLAIGGQSAFGGAYSVSSLSEIMPWHFPRAELSYREDLCTLTIPEPVRRHPILRVTDDPLADASAWAALPPLLAYNLAMAPKEQATVLMVHDKERVSGKPMPLLAVMPVNRGKTVAVGFRTFWRHGLMMWGIGKDDAVAQTFWKNVIRWLVTPEDVARIRVTTDKPTYRSGESVAVHAQVFDGLLEPLAGAEVVASVADGTVQREVMLRDLGNGRYAGDLGGFDQGDYQFSVQASFEGETFGKTSEPFTVDRYSLEYETVRMNEELLRAMATRSGGKFLKPEDLAEALAELDFAPEPIEVTFQGRLWGQAWPLYVLVGLLTVEWVVRRRRGMV